MAQHPALSEVATVGISLISTAVSALILSDAAAPAQAFALQWFLLPLLGALCASVCAMLLNPNPEARRTVFARSIFGVVFGCGVPKLGSMVHPLFKQLSLDPVIAFIAGFLVCMFCYIIARPFVEKLYGRAQDISDHLGDVVEKRVEQITIQTEKTTTAEPPPKQ